MNKQPLDLFLCMCFGVWLDLNMKTVEIVMSSCLPIAGINISGKVKIREVPTLDEYYINICMTNELLFLR